MTYREMIDAVRVRIEIEAAKKGISLEIPKKLIGLWISQAEIEIQRRFSVLRAESTVTLTSNVGTLPTDFGNMLGIEDDLTPVRWDEIDDDTDESVYAVDMGQIKVGTNMNTVDIFYSKKLESYNDASLTSSSDIRLPRYEKAIEYGALKNVFEEFNGLYENELRNVGFINVPETVGGDFG